MNQLRTLVATIGDVVARTLREFVCAQLTERDLQALFFLIDHYADAEKRHYDSVTDPHCRRIHVWREWRRLIRSLSDYLDDEVVEANLNREELLE